MLWKNYFYFLDILIVCIIVIGELINVFRCKDVDFVELWFFIMFRLMVFFVFGVGGYSLVNYVNVV